MKFAEKSDTLFFNLIIFGYIVYIYAKIFGKKKRFLFQWTSLAGLWILIFYIQVVTGSYNFYGICIDHLKRFNVKINVKCIYNFFFTVLYFIVLHSATNKSDCSDVVFKSS